MMLCWSREIIVERIEIIVITTRSGELSIIVKERFRLFLRSESEIKSIAESVREYSGKFERIYLYIRSNLSKKFQK